MSEGFCQPQENDEADHCHCGGIGDLDGLLLGGLAQYIEACVVS